jgi:hypothetical protein
MVPLKRRAHSRSATTGMRLAAGPGFEPGSFRLTAGRVTRCHHPTSDRHTKLAGRRGFEPRFAASEAAVLPLDDLPVVGSGGLEPPRTCARGRWATDYPTTRSTMV